MNIAFMIFVAGAIFLGALTANDDYNQNTYELHKQRQSLHYTRGTLFVFQGHHWIYFHDLNHLRQVKHHPNCPCRKAKDASSL